MDPLHRNRIRWRCRRGMKELDVLLEAFLAESYERLPKADRQAFERLLDSPDQDIMVWLSGQQPAPDPELARAVELLLEPPPAAAAP